MLILRELVLSDEVEARLAHHELESEGHDGFLLFEPDEIEDFATLIQRRSDSKLGINLLPGKVAATFWIAELAGQLAGRVSIRHELNDFLYNFGGHIGYMVRPRFRRLGLATQMLAQALDYCKTLGLDQVLLTCNEDNLGSIKVIESRGGILENKVLYEGALLRRYWIDLA